MYANSDCLTDQLLILWEANENEEPSDTKPDYEPDNNDDGFYDMF
jgi:hypothetical protein